MNISIIDISRDMLKSEIYPGDPAPEVSVFSSLSAGDSCNMARINSTLHCGTHIDAPLHFIDGGDPVDRLPLEAYVGECTVVEVPPGRITGEYADRHFPRAERLLIKGGGKAYLDRNAAEEIAFRNTRLFGTDALSVGSAEDQTGPHRALLGEKVAVLEGLNLENVKPGRYFLLAQPLKISYVEASPVRALLLDGYLFWSKS